MRCDEYTRWRKMLLSGIFFAAITMAGGELPIGWTVYPETDNALFAIIMGSGSLSAAQLAAGVLFGGIGIPLQYYGYKAIAEMIAQSPCTRCAALADAGAKAIAFGGGIVHVLCVALMYLCRLENTQTLTEIPPSVMEFAVWLVLPFSAVFMAIYIPMTFAIFIPIISGKTIFPKWAAVFNPLTAKIVLNCLAFVAPNTALMNGIRMSNMGLGSLLTFVGLLLFMKQPVCEQAASVK